MLLTNVTSIKEKKSTAIHFSFKERDTPFFFLGHMWKHLNRCQNSILYTYTLTVLLQFLSSLVSTTMATKREECMKSRYLYNNRPTQHNSRG